MAASDGIEVQRKHLEDGHLIQYSEHFLNFAGTLPLYFRKSFDFHCNAYFVTPTSWTLAVSTFQTLPIDGSLSYVVVIGRTDARPIYVNMEFWMRALPDIKIELPPLSFRERRVPRGFKITRNFYGVIPYEALRQLGDRSLLLQVSLSIHGCHTDHDFKRLLGSRKNGDHEVKALSSKL